MLCQNLVYWCISEFLGPSLSRRVCRLDFDVRTPQSKHGGLVWERRSDFLNASEKTPGFLLIW